jgi:AraC-like DNA-binding protein
MPVDVVAFSTTDPDVGHAALNEVYGAGKPIAFSGPDQAFACDLRFATAAGLGADRVRFTMVARAEMAPVDFFLAVSPVGGAQHVVAGRDEVQLRPGGVARYPIDSILVARGIFDVTTLRLPLTVLERVAEERLGADPADLRFDGMRPVSEPMRRTWSGLARFVHQQLADPAAGATHPLVEAQLVELVAATALAAFPNTTMSWGYLRSPGAVAPAVVRRALAFVDGHASLPITVTDIARAAGVGPRALQLAFARHLGCSPMAYVRRVRLEGAHRELQAADPTAGDTVAGIARRWGFAKADRFAASYRATYGVPPSHTLRT